MGSDGKTYRNITFYVYTVHGKYTPDYDNHTARKNLTPSQQAVLAKVAQVPGIIEAFFTVNGGYLIVTVTRETDIERAQALVMQAIESAQA